MVTSFTDSINVDSIRKESNEGILATKGTLIPNFIRQISMLHTCSGLHPKAQSWILGEVKDL